MKSIGQISESSHQKDKKSNDGLKKKKVNSPDENRLAFKLQFTDDKLNSVDLSEADFEKFKVQFPYVAKLLLSPDLMTRSSTISNKVTQENWQSAALQLLSAVWKIKEATIFHAPVDVYRLGIPDYLNIVKNPMDFGTIKVD